MSEVIRWVVCVGVGGLAALLLVVNWLLLFNTTRTKKPTSLVFPFVCGPICAASCWLSPSPFLQRWFWVPLAADFTLPLLIGLGVFAVGRLFARLLSPGSKPEV